MRLLRDHQHHHHHHHRHPICSIQMKFVPLYGNVKNWYHQPNTRGQRLTDEYLNRTGLNHVEVDNTISPYPECNSEYFASRNHNNNTTTTRKELKVVEYNAERGRWWFESVTGLQLLKDADIIILNEMDIGMARSDQQHTTRQMAYYLKMNYAWGMEFLELTNGNQEDLQYIPTNLQNSLGLHGNAFLTKCGHISDPVIFRNPIGEYFSDKKLGINAMGYEKRLGGRMGMFGKIRISSTGNDDVDDQSSNSQTTTLVVGSIHKLGEFGTSLYAKEVRQYIGTTNNSKVVIAGDQNGKYCSEVGLKLIKPGRTTSSDNNGKGYTWPASCTSYGNGRGDNICTNLNELDASERTTKPCYEEFGIHTQVGDHALTSVVLDI